MDSDERNNNAPAPELVNVRPPRLEDLMAIPLPDPFATPDPLDQLVPEMGRILQPGERLVFEPPTWEPAAPATEQENNRARWRMDQLDPRRTNNPERRIRPIHCPSCNHTTWSRMTSGTWTGTDRFYSDSSQWIERGEPDDSDDVEREPWECTNCGTIPIGELQEQINSTAQG